MPVKLCVGRYVDDKIFLFSGIRSGMLFETQEEVLLINVKFKFKIQLRYYF